MNNLVDKKVADWLDKANSLTVDPLGHLVIEDKIILDAISGGSTPFGMDDILQEGVGCTCCGTGC